MFLSSRNNKHKINMYILTRENIYLYIQIHIYIYTHIMSILNKEKPTNKMSKEQKTFHITKQRICIN
jgi:hypothetical protein